MFGAPFKPNLGERGRYLILDQEVDFGSEHWEFAPGSEVRCTLIELSGQTVLAAIAPN